MRKLFKKLVEGEDYANAIFGYKAFGGFFVLSFAPLKSPVFSLKFWKAQDYWENKQVGFNFNITISC